MFATVCGGGGGVGGVGGIIIQEHECKILFII